MRARTMPFLLLIFVTIALASCGPSDLTREEARKLIESSNKLGWYVYLQSDAENIGHAQGWWGYPREGPELKKSSALYLEGSRIDATVGTRGELNQYLLLHNQTGLYINVTGIMGEKNASTRSVEFEWRYTHLPSLVRRIAVERGTGNAVLQLYDDGWRFTELVSMTPSDTPYPLTDMDKKDQRQDVASARNLRRAVAAMAYLKRKWTRWGGAYQVDFILASIQPGLNKPDWTPIDIDAFGGQHAWSVVQETEQQRFKQLLGKDYDEFSKSIEVAHEVERDGNFLVGGGCMAHNCFNQQSIFTIDGKTGRSYSALIDRESHGIKVWGVDNFKDLPYPIHNWLVKFVKDTIVSERGQEKPQPGMVIDCTMGEQEVNSRYYEHWVANCDHDLKSAE